MTRTTTAPDTSILKPVLEDAALMAMIRHRHVPFVFVLKQAGLKPTVENAHQMINALIALRPGQRSQQVAGVIELDVNFAIQNEAFFISGGTLGETRGIVWLDKLTPEHISASVNAASRVAARDFAQKRYAELRQSADLYERVLRECERCESIDEALQRVRVARRPLDRAEFERIKSNMNRYGLMREPIFAKRMLLDGPLARQIEQQFLGERLDDVVMRLLRQLLAKPKA